MRLKAKIILSLLLLFLFLIIISEDRQQKINWYPSFAISHKIPYGSYVAYHEAKRFFGDKLEQVNVSPYIFFDKNPNASGTLVFYNSEVTFGKSALKLLLSWVEEGNNLFIASEDIDKTLLDTLNVDYKGFITSYYKKPLQLNFYNPHLKLTDTILFDKKNFALVFDIKEKAVIENYSKLGYFEGEDENNINFIDVAYGKGHIMLHSFPYVFTNYFILKSQNLAYYNGLLSYINLKKPVYWTTNIQNGVNNNGVFKYIVENPGFLWAYRLFFVGLLLYILFEGKRKQRAIPVVKPPKNETLDFTKTIADMYIENKEHKRIALLHIKHFMNYVRHQLHIDINQNPKELKNKISQKTKTDIKEVDRLFEIIETVQNQEYIKPEVVLELEKQIEKVKSNFGEG